ncbi:hypothetical protein MSG28_012927 [Choristoneura fumiferana]|uniref:Uncharacterized protein n=1 Tax=Choristoneura fumiferana TaxID=7141 RepID=A0ACC0KRX7_CHOFU|nr:hypothetical protein MSG28_012927 [Choristoneura fumiferana]
MNAAKRKLGAKPYGGPDDGDTTTQRHFLIPTRMGSGNDTTKHSKPDRARPKSLWQQIPQAQRKLASPRRNLTLNVTLSTGAVHMDTIKSDLTDIILVPVMVGLQCMYNINNNNY